VFDVRRSLLRVLAGRLRNLCNGLFGARVVLRLEDDVGLGDDADQGTAFVDDGDASHLFTTHEVHDVVHRIGRRARTDVGGHDVANGRRCAVTAFGDGADGNVAVGKDADEELGALGFDHGHDADVFGLHQSRGVSEWLRQQHLSYGLAGFWQAAAVSVESRGDVFVAPAINDGAGHVGPTDVGVRRDWYDRKLHDARFVIGWRGGDQTGSVHDLNDTLLNQYFGPPKSIKHIDVYVVYVYEYNLLDRLLPADQLPPQYQYRGGR